MKDEYFYIIRSVPCKESKILHKRLWIAFTEQGLNKEIDFCKKHNLHFIVETLRYETH